MVQAPDPKFVRKGVQGVPPVNLKEGFQGKPPAKDASLVVINPIDSKNPIVVIPKAKKA